MQGRLPRGPCTHLPQWWAAPRGVCAPRRFSPSVGFRHPSTPCCTDPADAPAWGSGARLWGLGAWTPLLFYILLALGSEDSGKLHHTIISRDNLGKKGTRGACPTRNQYLPELHMDSDSVTPLRDRGGSGNRAHSVEI